MEVFVTGATGVLGRPVVRLLAAGHRVRAQARNAKKDDLLRAMGAEPVRADLFDAASLREAVAGCDAVLHLATKIPATRTATRRGAWDENTRIRTEGTRNLVDAALAAAVRTLVYPGVCFVLEDGGSEWIDSSTAGVDAGPLLAPSLAAEGEVERFTRSGGRGISLRMGYFYGPEAGSAHDVLALARLGLGMMVGRAGAYFPSIWVDDAAAAEVAALERAPSGVYDVVDDEPLTRRDLAKAVARAAGRPFLLRLPVWMLRLTAGPDALFLARSQRVSNRGFKEATGWEPAVHDAREGWRRIAASASPPS
ncbi:MAG TPA: NAD-dependent epimerase/dehydratase family protein [Longimicrobiaceae bacterium]|nr:NAD-dependent epimerase/dehydratase family protein [Longimicrobiaceae bacterium]